ncbi:MAG: hypothetical protein DMF70_16275 [Acidobacteria bacterium]|nr:MAG: hypothetical protein DMF70_16275 [Acidobacteriota bacterium]
MKTFSFALLLCFAPIVVAAAPLKVVNVSAPAINCVFNPTCTVTVNDTSDNVTLSAGGTGFLQSRTYRGAAGSPAAGLFAYEYRLDLRNAVGALNIACINWMTISFGPVVGSLNYGGDAKPDQVFVVTGGGIGTIGIASAIQTGSNIRFNFTSPICEGGAPGKGDSSFFWGLVSKQPPKFVTATLHEPGGATHVVKARSPQ